MLPLLKLPMRKQTIHYIIITKIDLESKLDFDENYFLDN